MSRTNIIAYQELSDQIDRLLDDVNSRFATDNWQPIQYMPTDLPNLTLMALRRLARFCVVSSLHDGMNLVAKEYVASRYDHDGVLILSPFTGAAMELTDALIVNPYDIERFASALRQAVEMPRNERQVRMANMRSVVQENNIYKWAARSLVDMMQVGRRARRPIRSPYTPQPPTPPNNPPIPIYDPTQPRPTQSRPGAIPPPLKRTRPTQITTRRSPANPANPNPVQKTRPI